METDDQMVTWKWTQTKYFKIFQCDFGTEFNLEFEMESGFKKWYGTGHGVNGMESKMGTKYD